MIEIIPAIDLIDGECVRLTHGDFARKKVYSADPLETAQSFEAAGIRRLHMVDLDGAKSGAPKNLAVLERVAAGTNLLVDYGGGLRSETDVQSVFDAGAGIANIGSFAVREPETFIAWVEKYGSKRILLGADVKDGMIAIDGWQTATTKPLIGLLEHFIGHGVTSAFVTDIARDGALAGPSIELYETVVTAFPSLNLIASGGVTSMEDIAELNRIGCSGVIVGKAIYEGRITVEECVRYAG